VPNQKEVGAIKNPSPEPAQPSAGDGLGKAVPFFERQYLTENFYLYHSFSVIVARPLSFTLS
jgi:hypothetical protein